MKKILDELQLLEELHQIALTLSRKNAVEANTIDKMNKMKANRLGKAEAYQHFANILQVQIGNRLIENDL